VRPDSSPSFTQRICRKRGALRHSLRSQARLSALPGKALCVTGVPPTRSFPAYGHAGSELPLSLGGLHTAGTQPSKTGPASGRRTSRIGACAATGRGASWQSLLHGKAVACTGTRPRLRPRGSPSLPAVTCGTTGAQTRPAPRRAPRSPPRRRRPPRPARRRSRRRSRLRRLTTLPPQMQQSRSRRPRPNSPPPSTATSTSKPQRRAGDALAHTPKCCAVAFGQTGVSSGKDIASVSLARLGALSALSVLAWQLEQLRGTVPCEQAPERHARLRYLALVQGGASRGRRGAP